MQDPYYNLEENENVGNPDALRGVGAAFRKLGKNIDHITLGLTGVGGALVTFGGNIMQALDSLLKGKVNLAGKEIARGAVESGTMVLTNTPVLGWGAESLSVLTTGKYLSTHAGEVLGAVVDGADRAKQANVAAVSFSPYAQQMNYAPTGTAYMDPSMAQQAPAYQEMPAPGREAMHWRNEVAQQQGVDPDTKWAQYNRAGGEGAEHAAELASARENQALAETAR